MKYLIGAVIGVMLAVGGVAVASSSPLILIDKLEGIGYGGYGTMQKIYDKDADVICYTLSGGSSGYSISCLKNN